MSLKLITAPASEPITLNEARLHLKIIVDPADETAHPDDAYIEALIVAARSAAEHLTGRAFIEQELEMALDGFGECIRLSRPPLISLTRIKYLDINGNWQTLSSSDYVLDSHSEPARIVPAYGKCWPSTREQINSVVVRYVAGYEDADAVPQAIKNWMLLRVGMLYENREEVSGIQLSEVPYVDSLLDPYRVWSL